MTERCVWFLIGWFLGLFIGLCEYENEVEVIGNIHDNPELIGERKDNENRTLDD